MSKPQYEIIFILARKHVYANTSARASLADAMKNFSDGDLRTAINFALRSIAHSVGILHKDYARAFKASGLTGEIRLVTVTER